MKPQMQKILNHFILALYRRWSNATFIDGLHFSPVNIMDAVLHYYKMQPDSYVVPDISTISSTSGVGFNVVCYTLDNHPAVEDMYEVLKFCTPKIDLCEEWCFSDKQAIKAAKLLSQNDPYYATYLLEMAIHIGLLRPMPSLYVQRMQLTEEGRNFRNLPKDEAFRLIVDATIKTTSIGLQSAFPAFIPLFSEDGIGDLLINPMSTEKIINHVFEALGMGLIDLMQNEIDDEDFIDDLSNMSETESGIYVLGVMLDRFLFTPFGQFLRLIRPIYDTAFDIYSEISDYRYDDMREDDEFSAFFAPCTTFSLTPLGVSFFETSPQHYLDTTKIIATEIFESGHFTTSEALHKFIEQLRTSIPPDKMPDSIYTFQVKAPEYPGREMTIEVNRSASLHSLVAYITRSFILRTHTFADDDTLGQTPAYQLYHDKTPNPFAEYVCMETDNFVKQPPLQGKHRPKKNTDMKLESLDFQYMSHMTLVINHPPVGNNEPTTATIEIEWIGESLLVKDTTYPRRVWPNEKPLDYTEEELAPYDLSNFDET